MMSVNNPDAITDAIPRAKRVRHKNVELVLVKHDLDSTKVLRNMGLDAPTPMLYDGYNWPGMATPMSHQVQTADFATINRKLFILNATGTGKTKSAIWAADYLIARGHIKRILVVCPVSVIKVWQDELFSTAPHRSVAVLVGRREKRIELAQGGAEFCLINFDGLTSLFTNDKKKRIKKSPLKDLYDLIIVDEASTYRNGSTDRYEALKFLNTSQMRLWLMTGTPTPNAPTDAWAMTRLVSPSRVPDSFNLFRETVMYQYGPYKWVPKIGWQDVIRNVMQPAIRFEKKDCLDLPKLTYNPRYCELTTEQRDMFEVMRHRMKHEDESVTISAANAAVKLIKMQQICCGVVKDDQTLPVYLKCEPRLALLHELVQQTQHKTIVFVPFKYSMTMVKDYLVKQGYSVELVNGDVSKSERDRIFTAFQEREAPHILVAHPAVAAHGLTLTAADTIIWYAPIYSLEQYEQANARIERIGQVNTMTVYHIISHPFEAAIYDVLQKKGSLQSTLLNLYREVVG